MLETLVLIAAGLFLLGLAVFGIRMLAYIFSGQYELDQRIDRSLKSQPPGFHQAVVGGGEGGAPFDTYQHPPYSSWLILVARVTPQEGFEIISKKLDEADNKIVN